MKKIIIYTLKNGSNADYDKVFMWIKTNSETWAKIDETTFFTISSKTSEEIATQLRAIKVPWKKIVVSNWEHDTHWYGIIPEVSKWLSEH